MPCTEGTSVVMYTDGARGGYVDSVLVGCERSGHALHIRITIMGMNERKMQGREVPEEQVDAWVAEAEAGYDVEQLRRRGRPTRGEQAAQVVPVRFTDDEISLLMERAGREHLNRSEAIRRAVREWATA